MQPQRDDRRGDRLLGLGGGELGRRVSDDRAGIARRVELLERGMQADRLEIEELDPLDRADLGVDVAGQSEVDHERAGRALEQRRGHDVPVDDRAGQDDVAREGGAGQVGRRADVVADRELLGPAGRGVDGDVLGAAVAQRGEGGARVGAGADHEDACLRPVGHAAGGELEREAHERAAGGADGGRGLDGAGGGRGALEELFEPARGGAGRAGQFEGAAHLTRDLILADDDRLEAGGYGEEVLDDGVPAEDGHRGSQLVGAHPARLAHRGDGRLDRAVVSEAGGLGDLEIGLEPVAGGKHDRAAHEGGGRDEGPGGLGCSDGQLLEDVEARVPVVGGQAK